ncbi:MAG: DUF4491 family protein [Anaerolineales bacterium]|nr:DUF4491 family protein [Anaerolineales bacterium]
MTFGITLGFATLLIIGLGFAWVIYAERYLGYLWWVYFMTFGFALVIASLSLRADWASALLGAVGASFIWGSTELKEQSLRAKRGWVKYREKKIDPPFANLIKKWKKPNL